MVFTAIKFIFKGFFSQHSGQPKYLLMKPCKLNYMEFKAKTLDELFVA